MSNESQAIPISTSSSSLISTPSSSSISNPTSTTNSVPVTAPVTVTATAPVPVPVPVPTDTSAPVLSLYGVNIPEQGDSSGFSISFIILNMIGGGLGYFVAMAWSNVFQSALDRYKAQELNEGRTANPVWLNFMMAMVATVFAIAVMYIMMRMYTRLNSQNSVQL